MEDWQQWQIRADQIAADLGQEIDNVEREFFSGSGDETFRAFWPRFRDLKERVRTAPAIRLEAKLDLEKRLRGLGSRAYKAQEGVYTRSGERKDEVLGIIANLRSVAESAANPRDLRAIRREIDRIRVDFDAGTPLVPADRQTVWEAWSRANQFTWTRLTGLWTENETYLRSLLEDARRQAEGGNTNGARRGIRSFFESLKTREVRQESANGLKAEADSVRKQADEADERLAVRAVPTAERSVALPQTWRTDLERNREIIGRLTDEVAELDRQIDAADSILEQAMLRGTMVDKRRKLVELERANRALERRIEQSEETPLIPTA